MKTKRKKAKPRAAARRPVDKSKWSQLQRDIYDKITEKKGLHKPRRKPRVVTRKKLASGYTRATTTASPGAVTTASVQFAAGPSPEAIAAQMEKASRTLCAIISYLMGDDIIELKLNADELEKHSKLSKKISFVFQQDNVIVTRPKPVVHRLPWPANVDLPSSICIEIDGKIVRELKL